MSSILDASQDKIHAYKMLNDDDIVTNKHHDSFPTTQKLDNLPPFAHYDVDIIVSLCESKGKSIH